MRDDRTPKVSPKFKCRGPYVMDSCPSRERLDMPGLTEMHSLRPRALRRAYPREHKGKVLWRAQIVLRKDSSF